MSLKHIAPNAALMGELLQVSEDAVAVLVALATLNAFPETFPREALSDLCSSLRDLKDGTDEGCRTQLEAARNKLPKWRREHFLNEGSAEDKALGEDEVRFYRNMTLDQRLGTLLISATTALDEYRAQAQEHFDDTVGAEEILAANGSGIISGAITQSESVEASASQAVSELSERLDTTNERVDLLSRRLTDTSNLARTARSELRSGPMVRRWFKGIVDALKKTPELIGAAGRALQVGADVADLLADWWVKFQRDSIQGTIQKARELGIAFEKIERRLRQPRISTERTETSRPEDLPDLATFQEAEFAPEMVVIPAGEFTMGSPEDEPERRDTEGPQVEVRIKKFALGIYAVTFDEYDAFCRDTDRELPADEDWGRARYPAINVSWPDAQVYCEWLSEKTGAEYRLPSEAEWEYACRAGTETPFWWGDTITPDQANYDGSVAYNGGVTGEWRRRTLPVQSFEPNHWKLYQVHGNVWEWCADDWFGSHDDASVEGKPRGLESGRNNRNKVLRGGSWNFDPNDLRSAFRNNDVPDGQYNCVGFRVARTLTS